MEQLFAGYPCAIVVDDIIVGGCDAAEHDANLKKVLDRAREINLRLNPLKFKFRLDQVCYVGHIFTKEGLKADPTKTEVINKMPVPEDVPALQRFLGMVNYLGKYIPKLSEIAAPLKQLTRRDTAWCWLPQHQQAFDQLKSCLTSPPILAYYNVKYQVTLTCDASCYGLELHVYRRGGWWLMRPALSQTRKLATLRSKRSCWQLCLHASSLGTTYMEKQRLWRQTTSPLSQF